MELIDPFGRTVRDLRISITDRCNFRCTYCMPEEGMAWLDRKEILTFEEIHRLAQICVERFDVDSIRLTGGEPTVRAHLPVLVEKLAALRVPKTATLKCISIATFSSAFNSADLSSFQGANQSDGFDLLFDCMVV